MGLEVRGLELFGLLVVQSFRAWAEGFRVGVKLFRVQRFRARVEGLRVIGLRISGFRVSGCRVQGLGLGFRF